MEKGLQVSRDSSTILDYHSNISKKIKLKLMDFIKILFEYWK